MVEEAILATDLALHFQHLGRLLSLAEAGPAAISWDDHEQAVAVRAALMTASDLGGVTRPWPVQRAVVSLVTEEFWEQGDLERQLLSVQPAPLMDRARNYQMPKLQVLRYSIRPDNITYGEYAETPQKHRLYMTESARTDLFGKNIFPFTVLSNPNFPKCSVKNLVLSKQSQ